MRVDGRGDKRHSQNNPLTSPSSGKTAVKEENYPAEVNEVSQVDEGKIAAKRGQCFLFSLFPPRRRGKNGLGQDFTLLEDGRLHAVQ